MELTTGQKVGSLIVERELGRGVYGVVYLARDALIGRPVALKVILNAGSGVDPEARDQILEEARIVAGLSSPHVVTVYALHEVEGGFIQEMEFVGGGALDRRLEERGRLEPEEAVRVFRGICEGLRAAHEARVVHADVKPANVLFDEDDTVKIADFGVARILSGAGASVPLHGRVLGSPFYMAPEVISGQSASVASDIWSAGVTLHQMLEGAVPFPAETIGELIPKVLNEEPARMRAEVSGEVADVLRLCLAKRQEERPAAEELLAKLSPRNGRSRTCGLVADHDAPRTSFIGREREREELASLLLSDAGRLVSLVGPPGVGKSRLADEVCAELAGRLPDGCVHVHLDGVEGAAGIESAVGQFAAAGVPDSGGFLLVLDGVEGASADLTGLVGGWREAAPRARILVVSRAPLFLRAERRFALRPLREADGVRLLRERAGIPRTGGDEEEGLAAELVGLLDGNPLAIEDAARLVPERGVRALVEDPSPALAGLLDRIRRRLPRLDPYDRYALLQATVFERGFTLDAAEAVIRLPDDAPLVMDVVEDLGERSFLEARDHEGETRFELGAATRSVCRAALEELRSAADLENLADRHAAYYLSIPDGAAAEADAANVLAARRRVRSEAPTRDPGPGLT